MGARLSTVASRQIRAATGWETTIGTSVAVPDEISLLTDFQVEFNPNLTFKKPVGSKYVQIVVPGAYEAGARITFNPQGDYGFAAVMTRDATGSAGLTVDSAAASSTRYSHSCGDYPSPFTVAVWQSNAFAGSGAIDKCIGTFARRATITIEKPNPWQVLLECGVRQLNPQSGAQPSYTAVTHQPFHGHQTAIKIGGSQVDAFQRAEVIIDNALNEIPAVNNTPYLEDVRIEDWMAQVNLGYVVGNQSYWKNYVRSESVGDVDIIYKPTGADSNAYWQAARITLKSCYFLPGGMSKPITEGNTVMTADMSLRPTFRNSIPEVKFQYSHRTGGGYSGW